MSGFHNPRARLEFWLFAAVTFALATTNSVLALLALVLKEKHMSAEQIGVVLSSPAVPMVLTMLLAGTVVARLGALQMARAGALVILLSYASFELTSGSFGGAIASRVAYGIGHALFMPAGLLYIAGKLGPKHKIYYVGIYTSMYPLPNVIAPLVAEAYLWRYGVEGLFLYTAIPAVIGVALVLALTPTARAAVRRNPIGEYLQHLRDPRLWTPYGGIFFFGLCWGFTVSFMALLLESRDVPVAWFFTTFTVCVFGSRFLLVRYVQHLARPVLFGAALVFLGMAFGLLTVTSGALGVLAAGILIGLGHSIAYPTLGVWVEQQFGPQQQGMPLALFNALFTLGIFALPLIGGYVIAALGMRALVLALAIACAFVALAVLLRRADAPPRAGAAPQLPREP